MDRLLLNPPLAGRHDGVEVNPLNPILGSLSALLPLAGREEDADDGHLSDGTGHLTPDIGPRSSFSDKIVA